MQTVFELTATARRHADAQDLLAALARIVPDPMLQRGDIVEIVTAEGVETFIVHQRRLRYGADGSPRWVIELDHPARARS